MKQRDGDPLAGRRRIFRAGLLLLAATQAGVGLWALAAPRSFYVGFPGAGRQWISALGPYDEHLVRDVGAGLLALSVLVIIAAVSLDHAVIRAALVAWLVFAVPHLAFHVSTAERFGVADNIGNLTGLGLSVVVPIAVLVLNQRPGRARAGAVPDE